MTSEHMPWQLHPDLTQERLLVVAGIFRQVRDDVRDSHAEDQGETTWSAGARAYERIKHRIQEAAKAHPWLKIIESIGLRLTFTVGSVPMRFFTGRADKPSTRTRVRRKPELEQEQMMLFAMPEPTDVEDDDWFWRMAIEMTGLDLSRVVVLQVSSQGNARRGWTIPINTPTSAIASVQPMTKAAVRLQKPTVTPKKKKVAKVESDGA
jgi:hypothetical protein